MKTIKYLFFTIITSLCLIACTTTDISTSESDVQVSTGNYKLKFLQNVQDIQFFILSKSVYLDPANLPSDLYEIYSEAEIKQAYSNLNIEYNLTN